MRSAAEVAEGAVPPPPICPKFAEPAAGAEEDCAEPVAIGRGGLTWLVCGVVVAGKLVVPFDG